MIPPCNKPSLLLLDPPESGREQTDIDYVRQTLADVVSRIKHPSQASLLTILIALPQRSEGFENWKSFQAFLALVYTTIVNVCVQSGLNLEAYGGSNSIDVRVIPLDSFESVADHAVVDTEVRIDVSGWNKIFISRSKAVEPILDKFLSVCGMSHTPTENQLCCIQDAVVTAGEKIGRSWIVLPRPRNIPVFAHVCLGGTFDYLHPGHKLLLSAAVHLLDRKTGRACNLTIGITGDALLRNKTHAELIQSWKTRAVVVLAFVYTLLGRPDTDGWELDDMPTSSPVEDELWLRIEGVNVKCVVIQDAFGPTVTNADIDALIVSQETIKGAQAINEKRTIMGWNQLQIFPVDVLDANQTTPATKTGRLDITFASKLSSSAIRERRATDQDVERGVEVRAGIPS